MRPLVIASVLLLAPGPWLSSAAPRQESADSETTAIELGTRRELFVDDFLIERLEGARLKMHAPELAEGRLPFDRPWEGAFAGYATFLRDGDVYRMYYRGMPNAGGDASDSEVTCYAVSLDGIHWYKPDLGIYEHAGSRANNIVLKGHAPASHNFAPFIDFNPAARADERYKALGGSSAGLVPFASADGIHWRRLNDQPVITEGAFDSQNVSFWSESEQRYCCYFRTFTRNEQGRFRSISRVTSPDFRTWSKPEAMSFGNTPWEHLYTNQTSPYFRAPHIYIALAARFQPGKRVLTADQADAVRVNPRYANDCSDTVLMSTRGGGAYERTFMESFIRPGIGPQHWVSRSNYAANGVQPTGPAELSIYMSRNYGQPTAYLQRYTLRTDGFASVMAGYAGGEMVTRPLQFSAPTAAELAPRRLAWERQLATRNRHRSPRILSGENALSGHHSLQITQPVSIRLPGSARLGDSFTLAALLKDVPRGHRRLFSAYNGGSPENGELIFDFNSGGEVTAGVAVRFIWGRFQLTVPSDRLGDWSLESGDRNSHHLAVTCHRGTCTIYFDGRPVASSQGSPTAETLLLATDLHFGEDQPPTSTANEPLLGTIDDIIVLPRALDERTVKELATGGIGAVSGEVGPRLAENGPSFALTMEQDWLEEGHATEPVQRSLTNEWNSAAISLPPLEAVEFVQRELEINYATSAAGSITVEIQDASGNPIPGFAAEDCDILVGDEIERIVSWRGGQTNLGSLAGHPLRLRFIIKDADLYSFRFR